jgi:hypothetical protein
MSDEWLAQIASQPWLAGGRERRDSSDNVMDSPGATGLAATSNSVEATPSMMAHLLLPFASLPYAGAAAPAPDSLSPPQHQQLPGPRPAGHAQSHFGHVAALAAQSYAGGAMASRSDVATYVDGGNGGSESDGGDDDDAEEEDDGLDDEEEGSDADSLGDGSSVGDGTMPAVQRASEGGNYRRVELFIGRTPDDRMLLNVMPPSAPLRGYFPPELAHGSYVATPRG